MKTERTITIKHEDLTYTGAVMRIKETSLGYEDHGVATFMLTCEGDGLGVGVGGFVLDTNVRNAPTDTPNLGRDEYARVGTAYGLDAVLQVLNTAGVRTWEELTGQFIVVLYEGATLWGGRAIGFANLTDAQKVLIFEHHSDLWRDKPEQVS